VFKNYVTKRTKYTPPDVRKGTVVQMLPLVSSCLVAVGLFRLKFTLRQYQ